MNGLSLPIEIIEKILYFADGETLSNASSVCLTWNDLIENPSKIISEAWMNVCLEEIPYNFRIDIIQSLYPKYFFDESIVNWTIVYKSWVKWKKTKLWENDCFEVIDSADDISSAYKSGRWLIVAIPYRGRLVAHNIETEEEKLIFKGGWISCFRLICDLHPDVVDLDDETNYLPGIAHDKAVITLDMNADAIINLHTGHTEYFNAIGRTEDIRYFENTKIRLSRKAPLGADLFIYNIFDPDKTKHCTIWNTNDIFLLDLWKDKVLLSYKGKLVVDNCYFNGLPYENSSRKYDLGTNCQAQKVSLHRYCSVIINVSLLNLMDHELKITVEMAGSKVLYPYRSLRVNVTFVTFIAGVLFICTEQGSIYGYRVESLEDLLKVDLKEYDWLFEDIGTSIVHMDIEMGTTPNLWVSTKHSVVRLTIDQPVV